MKIVSINTVTIGSTGKIMMMIADNARQKGHIAYTACGYFRKEPTTVYQNHIKIGGYIGKAINIVLSKIKGIDGIYSRLATKRFLRKLDEINPDIIHLHNLHAWFINIPLLFDWIKSNKVKVIWTLHDCWSFTGKCPHFTIAKCDKWKTGCYECPQYRQYPEALIDRTKTMWKLKREWFNGVENMTIITPSQWLADLAKQSYLKDYPVKVINNGIDLNVFKPIQSSFREKYGLNKKYVILGVAFGWGKRKGLDVFIELSKRLVDKYQIVLVGTDDETDKQLPNNIISIHRTQNQQELAEIYSAADVFVNPTREENFPTVNIESIACGTPVVSFNTGGSPEIFDETCGSVVPCDDNNALYQEIIRICETKPFSRENCLIRAQRYDSQLKWLEYIECYTSLK